MRIFWPWYPQGQSFIGLNKASFKHTQLIAANVWLVGIILTNLLQHNPLLLQVRRSQEIPAHIIILETQK
jgi:hypothetical protein